MAAKRNKDRRLSRRTLPGFADGGCSMLSLFTKQSRFSKKLEITLTW